MQPGQNSLGNLDYNNALLRAALDEVKFGVVLLDRELRAQFINRAFRKMWRLPDHKADAKPPYVALMYHGRDTRAYDVPEHELDAYVAERVYQIQVCDPAPRDLRLRSGEVLRFQCVPLPGGGRMLSYTYITDIVQHSDELEILRAGLDNVVGGVILLDQHLNVRFANSAVRKLWDISMERLATRPPFHELVQSSRFREIYNVRPEDMESFVAARMDAVRSGDPTPMEVPLNDGRILRSQVTVLPDNGRMLTYANVTNYVETTQVLERYATTDSMTGVYNRRHFLELAAAEWDRFQRYQRPVSLLVFDIDHFKQINDTHGHHAGDMAICHVSAICNEAKRTSDIFARLGGDEFAMLLPETELTQAMVVAERIREAVHRQPLNADGVQVAVTLSVGLAPATLSQSSMDALMRTADEALYEAKRRGRNRVAIAEDKRLSNYTTAAE